MLHSEVKNTEGIPFLSILRSVDEHNEHNPKKSRNKYFSGFKGKPSAQELSILCGTDKYFTVRVEIV